MRNRRVIALGVGLVLLAASCGNSPGSGGASGSGGGGGSTGSGGSTPGTVSAADLQKHVTIDEVGVTDTEIIVGGVASKTNPLGGNYGDVFVGSQAYFDMVNERGGIYGRKIKVAQTLDDQLVNNQASVQQLISQDKVFAVVPTATLVFTGSQLLIDEKVPTFGWNINPEYSPAPNLFGEKGSYLCFTCPAPTQPWVAKQLGAKKVAILGYGISDQSKECTKGNEAAFKKFPVAEIAYLDAEVPFGETNLSVQVQKMKDAGVDFVTTCMDTNGVTTLAKEMQKQGLKATQFLYNAYDPDFLAKFGDLFQGSIVMTGFVPFETKDPPPALKEYFTYIDKAGGKRNEITMAGWLAADLFFQGLKAAGPDFNRQKVIDAINQMKDWNADGLNAGIDWTIAHDQQGPDTCGALLEIKGTTFEQRFNEPGKNFVCFPSDPPSLPDKPEYR